MPWKVLLCTIKGTNVAKGQNILKKHASLSQHLASERFLLRKSACPLSFECKKKNTSSLMGPENLCPLLFYYGMTYSERKMECQPRAEDS